MGDEDRDDEVTEIARGAVGEPPPDAVRRAVERIRRQLAERERHPPPDPD